MAKNTVSKQELKFYCLRLKEDGRFLGKKHTWFEDIPPISSQWMKKPSKGLIEQMRHLRYKLEDFDIYLTTYEYKEVRKCT